MPLVRSPPLSAIGSLLGNQCDCTYAYSTTIRPATSTLAPDRIQLSKQCRANSSHQASVKFRTLLVLENDVVY
jgi:hypothetical protein